MTKTKLRIAAAMLAVLLLTCAWIGAVSAADVTLSSETDVSKMTGVYKSNSKYWAAEDTAVKIPYKATGSKFISGYTADLTVQDKDNAYLTNAELIDKLSGWKPEGNFVTASNRYKLASAGSPQQLGTAPAPLFGVDIPASTLKTEKSPYTIIIPAATAALSTKDYSQITSSADVSAGTSIELPADFTLYVRGLPVINSFAFTDYYTVSPNGAITLYSEHKVGDNDVGNVPVTLNMNDFENSEYGDTVTWTSAYPAKYTVTSQTNNGINTLDYVADGSSTLTAKITDVGDESTVTVKYAKWFTGSYVENTDPTSATDHSGWNFNTEYTRTYTVGAGDIDTTGTGWNSGVLIAKLSRSGVSKTWQFTPSYKSSSDAVIMTYEIENRNADGTSYFIVTKNDVNNADDSIKITLTGKKLGDANKNGAVDIVDSAVVGIHFIRAKETPEPTLVLKDDELIYADCNEAGGDGIITVADILAINKFIVGLDPWFTPTT